MIELSFSKLLLLAVIGLIVLGPEKLPKAARMAGALLRRVRLGWESVRVEVERELEVEEIRRAAREAAGRADSVRKATEAEFRSAENEVKEAVDAAAKAVESAAGDAATATEPVREAASLPAGDAARLPEPVGDAGVREARDGDA